MTSYKECGIDIETYSSADLIKYGVYAYTDSPDFEVLLVSYSIDGGEVECIDLTSNDRVEDFLDILRDPRIIKTAYNANFERTCLARHFGVDCDPDQWRCTAVLAAQLGLPRSLKAVGEALELPEDAAKLKTGKALIDYFCKPCRPTKANGQRLRNFPHHAPDKWELFKEYNKQDVVAEQEIRKRLVKFCPNDFEQALWSIDQRINDRGVRLDLDMAGRIVAHDDARTEALQEEARELTGLSNPNSLTQLKAWLNSQGVKADTLNKSDVAAFLDSDIPDNVRRVLEIRQSTGLSSIKKYSTMLNMACSDQRCRGMMQFYGGHTGRWAGRGLQPQNLARPDMELSDLNIARELVKASDWEGVDLFFGDPAPVLSQLVRTAFIPSEGRRFVVSDFGQIEARVLAWIAGEDWRLDVFESGRDIYCESATRMFGVPVEKHGINGHLRQQGKVAELACIAEGQLVDTDQGLVPIEEVTQDMRVWDGEEWVNHGGVIYQGERDVLTYGGLTATPDHLVYVQEISGAVPFGQAAKDGSYLVRSGSGRYDIWLGADHKPREEMEQRLESLLRSGRVQGLWGSQVDILRSSKARENQGLPEMLTAEADTEVARQKADRCQAEMREPEGCGLSEVWSPGDSLRVRGRDGGRTVPDEHIQGLRQGLGDRQDRHQQGLCSRESEDGAEGCQSGQQKDHSAERVRPEVLALRGDYHEAEAQRGLDQRSDHRGCEAGSQGTPEELEAHSRKVKVYDIRDAGKHHRYTVQGCLVHNCGYGGGVGAIKSMDSKGAIPEENIEGIIQDWRSASPNIVRFWRQSEAAAIKAVKEGRASYRGLIFRREHIDGRVCLRIKLPSGRWICYFDARIEDGAFGEQLSYAHANQTTGKWEQTRTYGGKIVENCIAEDTPVLTDSGWKPIQNIEPTDKVWDGVKWVRHEGLISMGVQNVISVDGVEMTPDHKVLTEEGWKNASSCEGYNRREVVLPNSYLLCRLRRKEKHMEHKMRLRKAVHDARIRMEKRQAEVLRLYDQTLNITSQFYARNVENADLQRLALNEGALRMSDGSGVAQLRRQRYQGLQGMVGELRSLLSRYGSYLQTGAYTRQNRCERRLRAEQLPMDNSEGAVPEQALQPLYRYTLGQDNDSGSLGAFWYRRHHAMLQTKQRRRGRLAVRKTGHKKQVYDIKNSGSLHRFTVLGENGALIVHNCVQSIARDCLAEKMAEVDRRGYEIVFHVHDEMIVDTDKVDAVKEIDEIMCEPIEWAEGLPLKGDTFECEFYRK